MTDCGTALHCAAWEGSVECVAAILRYPRAARSYTFKTARIRHTVELGNHGSLNCGNPRADHAEVARLLLRPALRARCVRGVGRSGDGPQCTPSIALALSDPPSEGVPLTHVEVSYMSQKWRVAVGLLGATLALSPAASLAHERLAEGGARDRGEQRNRSQITERLASRIFISGAARKRISTSSTPIKNVQAVRLDVRWPATSRPPSPW